MFSSPTLSRSNQQQASPINRMATSKHLMDEQSKTIEQLKNIIDQLQIRHERKERELMKRVGILYQDLQHSKRKMAHLIYKQQQKKSNDEKKSCQDFSTQTDQSYLSLSSVCPHCSTPLIDVSPRHDENLSQFLRHLQIEEEENQSEQLPKYYTLQPEDGLEYISATPEPMLNQSLSSPSLSTTDRSSSSTSSTKHNESSSSAYNTAESLPSSTYSDEIESLERVLNAACTMYTTHDNLEHTIKLQEELFRQRLRLRGITVDNGKIDLNNSSSSEHLYDNIDGETSDAENPVKQQRISSRVIYQKLSKANATLSTDDDEQQQQHAHKIKLSKAHKVRFLDQHHAMAKRKTHKSSSRTNLTKSPHQKRSNSTTKKLSIPVSSNMLTVTIA